MRIISVHLRNIKSHRNTDLTFSPGINVLSGANGSGKSTIFEAIGFALFGVPAQDFVSKAERFVSIGAKKGEVTVVFEPADGERYRVTRPVSGGRWLLAKESAGVFEVEEHANARETEQRIASLLGLSTTRALSDQFKLVIGPFQNDFLGPFVIRQPSKRQSAFDEILGIDTWRKTFEGTLSLVNAIGGKIDLLQAEIAGKSEQVAVLPEKEQELSFLKESSAAKQGEMELRQRDLTAITARVSALDAQKERIDLTQNEVGAIEERIRSGKDHVATQQVLAAQSESAAQAVAAASAGKLAYDAAEEKLKGLRDQEKQKALLEKRLAELEKEQSAVRAALAIETRERAELEGTLQTEGSRLAEDEKLLSGELVELKKLQSDADQGLARTNLALARFRELPVHRIDNVLPYLFTALERIAALETQLAEREKLLAQSATLKGEAADLATRQRELEKVQGERSELAGRRLSLIEGREKIGAGDCPYFHEPCRNLEAGGGVDVFNSRIAAIEAEITRLDADAETVAGRVTAAQGAAQRLAGIEQVLLELDKAARERERLEQETTGKFAEIAPERLIAAAGEWAESAELNLELKDVMLDLCGSPQQRRALLSDWSDRWRAVILGVEQQLAQRVQEAEAPVRSAGLKVAETGARLQALEGKRRELAVGQEKLIQREKAIQAHQGQLDRLVAGKAEQETSLAAFAGLEGAIKSAAEELERFQPDRDRYIANQAAAAELAKRQETLVRYHSRLKELELQIEAKRVELQGLAAQYRAEDHEAARIERDRVVSVLATLKAEVAGIADGVRKLELEITALKRVAEEIAKKQGAIEELKGQGELVKFLRNQVFRNVSSQLSERFREEISSRADRIYRSISESDEELFWGEDYQIVLKDMDDGVIRERTDDQLSGGQMMSAVVALRLALLQTVGARIAFFDEPTSNLDAERRENLAKAFRAIDVGQEEVTEHWYDQLFLVSHDVSFTEITDQMIHLD